MKYPKVQIIIDILSRVDDTPKSKLGFDMLNPFPSEYTHHPCGTACCIGGWANRALELVDGKDRPYIQNALSELTDIPLEEARSICFPPGKINYRSISLKVAIKMLRKYRDTGNIDWYAAGAKRERT